MKNINTENKITKTDGKKPPKWFYLVLLLIPVIFFVLLEIVLQILNYGNEYKVFVPLAKSQPDKLFFDHEITQKYFTNLII